MIIGGVNSNSPSFQFNYSEVARINNNQFSITANNAATSTSTGALVVTGGAGIGGSLYVGGTTSAFLGNVGIGTSSPTNKFEVQGTSGQLFSVSDSFTGTIFAVNDIAGIPSIEVLDSGLVKFAETNGSVTISTSTGVGTSGLTVWTSTFILSLGVGTAASGTIGEIRASNEITAYYSSDIRLKENISVISNPIEKIKQIRGVEFDWKEDYIDNRGGEDGYFVRKNDVGVIAQEIESILPQLVGTRSDGYKAVKYEKITALLIEAIKEQQRTIDKLIIDIENLKQK